MIKLTQLISELGINNPNTLIPGKKYQVYNDISKKWEILEFDCEYANRWSFITKYGSKSMGKDYYIKNKWIKPYKEEVNELGINKPNVSVKEIYKYFSTNILRNHNNDFWEEYIKICKPYFEKYDINSYIGSFSEFEQLSQSDRNQFYREMKQLVQKYANNINELQATNPNKTVDEVFKLYKILNEKFTFSEIYYKAFDNIIKDTPFPNSVLEFLSILDKNQLNKIYQKLKQLDTHGK